MYGGLKWKLWSAIGAAAILLGRLTSRRRNTDPVLISSARHFQPNEPGNHPAPPGLTRSPERADPASYDTDWSPDQPNHGGVQTRTRPATSAVHAPAPVPQAQAAPRLLVREGRDLILHPTAALPGACVRCAAPATTIKTKSSRYHHPMLYLLLIAGPFLYVPIALGGSRKFGFQFGYCATHNRRHWQSRLAMTAIFVASIAALILSTDSPRMLGAGVIMAHIAVIGAAVIGSRSVRAVHIDSNMVKLRGFGRPFLAMIRP